MHRDTDESRGRWATELRAFLAVVFALAVICGALIAQPFWGNGAMVAILAGGVVVYLLARYAPAASRHQQPRTH